MLSSAELQPAPGTAQPQLQPQPLQSPPPLAAASPEAAAAHLSQPHNYVATQLPPACAPLATQPYAAPRFDGLAAAAQPSQQPRQRPRPQQQLQPPAVNSAGHVQQPAHMQPPASQQQAAHLQMLSQFAYTALQQAGAPLQMLATPSLMPESSSLVREDTSKTARSRRAAIKVPRWNITREVLEVLEEIFQFDKFPSAEMRRRLATDFGVSPRQIQFWFQNRRQRERRQTPAGAEGDDEVEGGPAAAPEDIAAAQALRAERLSALLDNLERPNNPACAKNLKAAAEGCSQLPFHYPPPLNSCMQQVPMASMQTHGRAASFAGQPAPAHMLATHAAASSLGSRALEYGRPHEYCYPAMAGKHPGSLVSPPLPPTGGAGLAASSLPSVMQALAQQKQVLLTPAGLPADSMPQAHQQMAPFSSLLGASGADGGAISAMVAALNGNQRAE